MLKDKVYIAVLLSVLAVPAMGQLLGDHETLRNPVTVLFDGDPLLEMPPGTLMKADQPVPLYLSASETTSYYLTAEMNYVPGYAPTIRTIIPGGGIYDYKLYISTSDWVQQTIRADFTVENGNIFVVYSFFIPGNSKWDTVSPWAPSFQTGQIGLGKYNADAPYNFTLGFIGEYHTAYIKNVTMSQIVPEPATMSLLALGGLALLRRRK